MEADSVKSSNQVIKRLKAIFLLKKTKMTLYIVAVLWMAVITQIIMNYMFFKDFKIAEAFVMTNTQDMECDLEIMAEYRNNFLSETDKRNILYHIADAIGLKIDGDITINKVDSLTEYLYHKQAKKAETIIKIVSMEQEKDSTITMKHYIVVRLNIKESINSIENYRGLIEDALLELDILQKQVTVQYEGSVQGLMSIIDKEEMALLLVKELQGEIVFNYQQGESYTVYAYTGLINEYIESVGCKINIQVAMTYDEELDKTQIYLATPIINQGW